MAEAAGLAIGVLSLAALCSTCLEAFSLIGAGKDFSVDAEIMSIRLDMEKTRLLQWAEAVGLLTDDRREQNDHLLSSEIQSRIERILSAVMILLTRSEDLRQRYGLYAEDAIRHAAADDQGLIVSTTRYQRFQTAFTRLQNRLPRRQKEASLATKVRWVIKDRNKFEEFLSSLHDLISGLIELVALPRSFQRLLVKEDIDALADDLSQLRLVQAASSGQSQDWCEFSSLRVEMSQRATQDFRTLKEWLEDIVDANQAPAASSPSSQTPALGQSTKMDDVTDSGSPKSPQSSDFESPLEAMNWPPLPASWSKQQLDSSPDETITQAMVILQSLNILGVFQPVANFAVNYIVILLISLLQGLAAKEVFPLQALDLLDIRASLLEYSEADSHYSSRPAAPFRLWPGPILSLEPRKSYRSRDASIEWRSGQVEQIGTYPKLLDVEYFLFDFTGNKTFPSDERAVYEFRVFRLHKYSGLDWTIEMARAWSRQVNSAQVSQNTEVDFEEND